MAVRCVSLGSVLRIESNENILEDWRAPCHSRDASCDSFRTGHNTSVPTRAALLAKTFGVSSVVERLVYTQFQPFFVSFAPCLAIAIT